MLGGMAMKWRWRKRMEAAGKPTDKPNLVCGPVQICWHKFARYWDVELREIPMRPGQLFMDPKRMIEACDENTIGVVPTFGITYTGNYEFPQPLHDALDKFQADTGIDIDMHIDAASGGFLAPFVAPDIVWDFRLPRVKSISASATNSVWLRWAAAGLSGVTKKRCRRNWCSTLTTSVVRLVLSPSTSPARRVR